MLGALVILATEMFTRGLGPIDAGATPPAMLSAAACADCHPDITAEWARSRHAVAWTNGIFQREYRQKPSDWCVHCHAPLAARYAEVARGGSDLADEGINCAVCHVRDGRVHARRRRPGSPHDTVVDADFGGPAWCGGCHEFGFPLFDAHGAVTGYSKHPMQATVSQFLAGPHADRPGGCRGCHAATPAGHRYPGAHDPAMLAKALDLHICRDEGDAVAYLANVGAGHHVPTGDVHRHVVVRAWRSSAPERLFEAFVGRRFQPDPEGGKRTIWDSTIPAGMRRTWRVPVAGLGGAADEPLNFEVRYVYTSDEMPLPGRDPGEATVRVVETRRAALDALPPCTPAVLEPLKR